MLLIDGSEKLASVRVNAYIDKLMLQQAGFIQIPPPLEELMKQKYTVTVNQAAMDKAVTASAALKSKADSARAKNAPPTEVPMGGMQMPQGAPAPAPAPPAHAPKPTKKTP